MTDTTALQPVVREVVAAAPIDTCYRVFVDEFASWWPFEHHIGEDRTITTFIIEPFVGGRCYDIDTEGGENHWGTVLELSPPDRFRFAWHIQGDWTLDHDPAHQSEVDVTFTALGPESTSIHLEHSHLDRHLRGPEGVRDGISGEGGWGTLIGRAADVAEGRPPRPIPH